MSVGYLTAFLAGALALLSPCGALLLPSYFAVTFTGRDRLAGPVAFWAGATLLLAPLGAGVAAAGALVTTHRDLLVTVGGWTIVVLGVVTALGGGLDLQRWLPRRLREAAAPRQGRSGVVTAGLLGIVSAVAGFCAGPILGAVLTLAATGGSPAYGAALLAVYAAGMAAPLGLLAWAWGRWGARGRGVLRGRAVVVAGRELHTTSLLTGALLVGVGVLFLVTDGLVGVPGLVSTDTAARVQQAAADLAARVPDAVAIAVPAALLLLAWWLWWRRAGRAADAERPPAVPEDD